jgi:hypothetical protein
LRKGHRLRWLPGRTQEVAVVIAVVLVSATVAADANGRDRAPYGRLAGLRDQNELSLRR